MAVLSSVQARVFFEDHTGNRASRLYDIQAPAGTTTISEVEAYCNAFVAQLDTLVGAAVTQIEFEAIFTGAAAPLADAHATDPVSVHQVLHIDVLDSASPSFAQRITIPGVRQAPWFLYRDLTDKNDLLARDGVSAGLTAPETTDLGNFYSMFVMPGYEFLDRSLGVAATAVGDGILKSGESFTSSGEATG